ncbi:hypothetical protein [Limnoglobus roseus]|uniref:Uncharacterized protein n=1 Tax=Limnoglobus roseus TaxID=2598579 RepID=A0A5C1AHQ4_9BACT|nr:hypothetical protein [Limnoglobus roseus]QEL18969.1 hypothetical protein PX52LOC_06019 [Limnoglobus roseus]
MSTFLVLPPRELLEHAVTEFVNRLMPGLPKPLGLADVLLAHVVAGLPRHEQAFVIYREELPDGADTASVLQEAFGAEPGDRVLEIGPPRNLAPASLKETFIVGTVSALPAAR